MLSAAWQLQLKSGSVNLTHAAQGVYIHPSRGLQPAPALGNAAGNTGQNYLP